MIETGKFRQRTPAVEALRIRGDVDTGMVAKFSRNADVTLERGSWGGPCFVIPTPTGNLHAFDGDWIIVETDGRLRVLRHDLFRLNYEAVIDD